MLQHSWLTIIYKWENGSINQATLESVANPFKKHQNHKRTVLIFTFSSMEKLGLGSTDALQGGGNRWD